MVERSLNWLNEYQVSYSCRTGNQKSSSKVLAYRLILIALKLLYRANPNRSGFKDSIIHGPSII